MPESALARVVTPRLRPAAAAWHVRSAPERFHVVYSKRWGNAAINASDSHTPSEPPPTSWEGGVAARMNSKGEDNESGGTPRIETGAEVGSRMQASDADHALR